jgi:opacity protein-like surface antigen
MNKKIILSLLAIAVFAGIANADSNVKGITSMQFLKMGVGARPIGMGEAFVAGANDINSIYWNPAGLIEINDRQATFMQNFWFEGINAEYLAYAQPIEKTEKLKLTKDRKAGEITGKNKEKVGAVGLSFTYVGYGSIPRTYEDGSGNYDSGRSIGTFSASDLCFGFVGAIKLGNAASAGLNLKILSSTIETYSSFGIALDAGIIYALTDNLKIGIMAQNLGTATPYDTETILLPTNLKIGASYDIMNTKMNKLCALVDVNIPTDNLISLNAGVEYSYNNLFSVRFGYKGSDPAGITVGGGTKISNFLIDYAFVPYGELGNSHRISVTALF